MKNKTKTCGCIFPLFLSCKPAVWNLLKMNFARIALPYAMSRLFEKTDHQASFLNQQAVNYLNVNLC